MSWTDLRDILLYCIHVILSICSWESKHNLLFLDVFPGTAQLNSHLHFSFLPVLAGFDQVGAAPANPENKYLQSRTGYSQFPVHSFTHISDPFDVQSLGWLSNYKFQTFAANHHITESKFHLSSILFQSFIETMITIQSKHPKCHFLLWVWLLKGLVLSWSSGSPSEWTLSQNSHISLLRGVDIRGVVRTTSHDSQSLR